ncbi:related to glycosyl hydrolase [Cephalotrichum gorgonifer]|uniref:Related to glycosyl hydrolase n=1 Tax=Cephalotrichum gorgonifer TaxID=2041049 RepID=A0AAE8MXG3_9PEZI|nr:related to glycosyl hydrolase [Cephalotrichum gorgonifer]
MKLLALYTLPLWLSPSWALRTPSGPAYCSIFKKPVFNHQNCEAGTPKTFVDDDVGVSFGDSDRKLPSLEDPTPLELAYGSLVVMQREFWDHNRGTWPRAIDWTAAFIHTSLSGMTDTLSRALGESYADDVDGGMIRNLAFDDILWVVLGWLESTNLIQSHSALHYPREDALFHGAQPSLGDTLVNRSWHGNDWTGSFDHRSREFWDLANRGWGESLCGGGMRWSPHLLVYKNAITNQLWIAASAKMYLDSPGDAVESPYDDHHGARNRTYLEFAMKGYDWLIGVNMTNDAGLFVDGYHVSRRVENNTKCDEREESVYTYNQGVILTGQRGLWEATGSQDFLRDGHELIQNVILATGWDIRSGKPIDEVHAGKLPPWRGIGRAGVLEERCDSIGRCSQNGQTFKGIYFHHLTYFCAPIAKAQEEMDDVAFIFIAAAHARACKSYLPWIAHNAEAALATRDERGVFGGWWGADNYAQAAEVWESDDPTYLDSNTTDYRNFGIPDDGVWAAPGVKPDPLPGADADAEEDDGAWREEGGYLDESGGAQLRVSGKARRSRGHKDPNKRGRGRTVETQNSGMSVVRAWWELSQAYSEKELDWTAGFRWMMSRLWSVWVFGASFFWKL